MDVIRSKVIGNDLSDRWTFVVILVKGMKKLIWIEEITILGREKTFREIID